MKTSDVTVGNVAKIAALWPQCVTERLGKDGKPELAIDFDKLRAELSSEVLDEGEERYQFTWPDKRAASRLANTPSDMTLRPCIEESVGKDGTPGGFDSENLYIEGDNLEVLKLLREDYLGKVKMIYIDPPYNTGNDFVYNDDFAMGAEEFAERGSIRDDEGNLIVDPMQRNTESNGRFHTDWLNMIYPRLKVARDLVAEDGVIFISIDDNEVKNLKNILDEIFGEPNFIGQIVVAKGTTTGQDANGIGSSIDYMLIYAKNKDNFIPNGLPLDEEDKARFNMSDERGLYSILQYRKTGTGDRREDRPNLYFPLEAPDGTLVYPIGPGGYESRWRADRKQYDKWKQENMIYWKKDSDNQWKPYVKYYLEGRTKQVSNLWDDIEGNKKASITVKELLGKNIFDFPKPVGLIRKCLIIASESDSLILDFFSGSATTAHAVMQLNVEDGGKRRFIMVQLPEVTEADSEARKAGYANICEIGKERIRRAGRKVKEEAGLQGQDLDIGFRVLKLDSSNMEDVFYTPEDFDAKNLFTMVDNVKEGRTAEDLLFQIMPELNIPLSAKIEVREINGKKVFVVDDGYLVATFDKEVNTDAVKAMAQMKPQYFVMRDASAESDNVLDDFEQIFRHYSPDTVRKIL